MFIESPPTWRLERTPVSAASGNSARESEDRPDITVRSSTTSLPNCASNCSPSPSSARPCQNKRSGQGAQREERLAGAADHWDRRGADVRMENESAGRWPQLDRQRPSPMAKSRVPRACARGLLLRVLCLCHNRRMSVCSSLSHDCHLLPP